MPKNILLVDDHKMITEFCYNTLTNSNIKFNIRISNTLEDAYHEIFSNASETIDLILLDLSMPPYIEKKINNGLDLAKVIRKEYPNIKIIIMTAFINLDDLQCLLKDVYPDGLLEKADINPANFNTVIIEIINGKIYKSKSILNTLEESTSKENFFDTTNIKIIKFIQQGILTKNIPLYLPITLSAVKKRKLKIKKILNVEFGNNEDIVREAKKRKIIN
jgi:two-component system response regulator NreC